jgi:branched-chain amino acid transport system substrate-binding protein
MNKIKRQSLLFVMLYLASFIIIQAQDSTCVPLADDAPTMTVGLVFPAGLFITPNRVQYYEGAVAMLDAMNRCGGEDGMHVDWVHESAEDYGDAVDAMATLVQEHDVKLVIGGGSSAVSMGLSDAAGSLGIIFWETTEGTPVDGSFSFSITSGDFKRGEFTANFIRITYGDDAQVALIYNELDRPARIAKGIRDALKDNILIDEGHDETLNSRALALDIRRQEVDVVVLVAFQEEADKLWRAMRDEDANVDGWLNVGDPGYRNGLCRRIGETDGLITIHRFAMTSPDNTIFEEFASYYQTKFGLYPTERAHLTASGVYMLLRYVLPQLDSNPSVDAIRDAIYSADADIGEGLMGEGLRINPDTGNNQDATLVVQQNQSGQFCTVSPSALATCDSTELFSTWRERAIIQDEQGCTEPWANPDL